MPFVNNEILSPTIDAPVRGLFTESATLGEYEYIPTLTPLAFKAVFVEYASTPTVVPRERIPLTPE